MPGIRKLYFFRPGIVQIEFEKLHHHGHGDSRQASQNHTAYGEIGVIHQIADHQDHNRCV